jgi:hypothetical protein
MHGLGTPEEMEHYQARLRAEQAAQLSC